MLAGAYQRRIEHEAQIMAAQMALMFVQPSTPSTGSGNGSVYSHRGAGRRRPPPQQSHGDPLMGAGDADVLRQRQLRNIERKK